MAEQRMFGERVNDNAKEATYTLELSFGDAEIALTRSLANLKLEDLRLGGERVSPQEDKYQELVKEHAEVAFGPWVRAICELALAGNEAWRARLAGAGLA